MKLDEFFKFKIGETVRHIVNKKQDDEGKGHVLFIAGRTIEQCPGGEQFHYNCRVVNDNGIGTNQVIFNEVELIEFDEIKDAELLTISIYENFKRLEKMKLRALKAAREEFAKESKDT